MGLTERDLLISEVQAGRLMQVATLDPSGQPLLCHVWYAATFAPDRLLFISRATREHSTHIRTDARTAGAIVAEVPAALGATVRGVTFTGTATELPPVGIDIQIATFLHRWPQAEGHLTTQALQEATPPGRLYEIAVTTWVLFDEEHYPDQPRRPLPAQV
jgi:Pyridoxamine 5'-phosphate oxidase